MNAKKLIELMPQVFNPQSAGATKATIQYNITDGDTLHQKIENGTMSVHDGQADTPDIIISMSDTNFVKLFKGELNPMTAFMTGKIKVKGDITLAQKLVTFVDQDKINTLT
jgi:putative sterol carrier protein